MKTNNTKLAALRALTAAKSEMSEKEARKARREATMKEMTPAVYGAADHKCMTAEQVAVCLRVSETYPVEPAMTVIVDPPAELALSVKHTGWGAEKTTTAVVTNDEVKGSVLERLMRAADTGKTHLVGEHKLADQPVRAYAALVIEGVVHRFSPVNIANGVLDFCVKAGIPATPAVVIAPIVAEPEAKNEQECPF